MNAHNRRCPRCQRASFYMPPDNLLKREYSRQWEKVPDTCDLYLTGKGQPIQQPGSPLWLGGQEVCSTCAASIPYQFHYSRYWGTWSRVLLLNHRDTTLPTTWVEVNLTPIPDSIRTWQESVAPIIIRSHGTVPQRGEGSTTLPDDIKELMYGNIGAKLTDCLIHDDLWVHIDPARLQSRMQGGGVPFESILKH